MKGYPLFNHIRGTLAGKYPTRLIVEANGVGYDLTVSLSTSRRTPTAGEEVLILTHLVVREDDMRLIGFIDEDERALFRRLIDLSGVGPAMALQILSSVTPRDFALAIERQDSGFLKKIKGIGEKTAKRIILELKGAKTILPPEDSELPQGIGSDAAAALAALGIPANEAASRVEKVLVQQPDATLEELIKLALR